MMYVETFFDEPTPENPQSAQRLGPVVAQALSDVLNTHKVSMFGVPEAPVSDLIRAAVVSKTARDQVADVLLVDRNGLLLSFRVPFANNEEVTNAWALTACDAALAEIEAGREPRLAPAGAYPVLGLNPFSAPFNKGFKEKLDLPETDLREATRGQELKKIMSAGLLLRGVFKKRLHACRKTIFTALDPEVRRAITRNLEGHILVASRITGADGLRHHPDWARRRAEILKVADQYPAFLPAIRDPKSALMREVDAYGNMSRGIMEDTGLNAHQLKALRGKTVHALIHPQGAREGTRRDDWAAYRNFSHDVLRGCKPRVLVGVHALFSAVPGPMTTQRAKFMDAAAWEATKDKDLAKRVSLKGPDLSQMKDTATFLMNEVIRATAKAKALSVPETQAFADLMLPQTLRHFSAASLHHHNGFSLADFRATIADKEVVEWDPLIGEHRTGEAVVREIASREGLVKQGSREGHCVGGYDDAVMRGASATQARLILSVEEDARVLGTAEISVSLREGDFHLTVRQHMSRHNSKPCARADELLAAALKAAKAKLKPEDLARYADGMADFRSGKTRHQGEDAGKVLALIRAWPLYAPLLSAKARKIGTLEGCLDFTAKAVKEERAGIFVPRLNLRTPQDPDDFLSRVAPGRHFEATRPIVEDLDLEVAF